MSISRTGDYASMARAFSFPGSDPREWLSYGTVSDEDPVEFDEEEGGPLVAVILQPSKIEIRCRVLMQSAGKGEGEYVPFVAGDEVLVALPEGSSWSGGVIMGRLTNGVDKFPIDSVAGQDPSQNNFAFKRTRSAYIHEVAGGYTLREATSGAFLQLTKDGNVTIRDGSKGALQMSADVLGYQSGDGKHLLQIDLSGKRFTLQVNDALLMLAAGDASPSSSALVSPGSLSISAAAQPAAEHATTTEAVCNLIVQVLKALGTANPGPILGASLVGVAPTVVAAAVPLAAVQPQDPLVGTAIFGMFSAATQKPAPVQALGQTLPGIGCAGVLMG